jgi:hypothetical protein
MDDYMLEHGTDALDYMTCSLDDHETKLEEKDAERKRGIADRTELNLVALAKMAAEGSISQKD